MRIGRAQALEDRAALLRIHGFAGAVRVTHGDRGQPREPRRVVRRELGVVLQQRVRLGSPRLRRLRVAARERDLGELLEYVPVGLADLFELGGEALLDGLGIVERPTRAVAARDRPLGDARRDRIAHRFAQRRAPSASIRAPSSDRRCRSRPTRCCDRATPASPGRADRSPPRRARAPSSPSRAARRRGSRCRAYARHRRRRTRPSRAPRAAALRRIAARPSAARRTN